MGYKNPEEHKKKCHEYYLAHREEMKRRQREWNATHKEHISAHNKAYAVAHKKEILEYAKKYREENKEKISEYLSQWRKNNPEKTKAYRARRYKEDREYKKQRSNTLWGKAQYQVHLAVKSGRLIKQPCEVCGAEETHAHHDDYNEPLNVRWLCPKCHNEWHRNNKPVYKKGVYEYAK